AGFAAGFLAPDWELERRLAARRRQIVMELPSLLDLLTIACSAGQALEQALATVARQSRGVVGIELQRAVREAALGQGTVVDALAAAATRNDSPELSSVAWQLRAAYGHGAP